MKKVVKYLCILSILAPFFMLKSCIIESLRIVK